MPSVACQEATLSTDVIFINQWGPQVFQRLELTNRFPVPNFGVTCYSGLYWAVTLGKSCIRARRLELTEAFCRVVAKSLLATLTSVSSVRHIYTVQVSIRSAGHSGRVV